MKKIVSILIASVIPFACTNDNIGPDKNSTKDEIETDRPVKEIHSNLETGDIIAVKTFKYDNLGNLTEDSISDKSFGGSTVKNFYEYNSDNQVTKLTTIFPDVSDNTYTLEYAYEGELKMIERKFYANSLYETVNYFYSGNNLDSTVVHYATSNLISTYYFEYDNKKRLFKESFKDSWGKNYVLKINSYQNNLLITSCNPVSGIEGEHCIKNAYDSNNRLQSVYETLTATDDALKEEFSYKDNKLNERKVYNQVFSLHPYGPDYINYTRLIKYEY